MRCWLLPLALTALCAGAETLVDDGFEKAPVGGSPAPWLTFVDAGNSLTVTDRPALGQRSVKFVRGGGSVWKPVLGGQVNGQAANFLRFEFDVQIGALSDRWDHALSATLRGDGNVAMVQVALGGPGGVAVPDERGQWLALDFPLQPGSFAHVVIVTDPLARGADAAYDLTVTQGAERLTVPNIPFRRPSGAYPANWWFSPTFQLGGGTPDRPQTAWLDNVKITTVEGR